MTTTPTQEELLTERLSWAMDSLNREAEFLRCLKLKFLGFYATIPADTVSPQDTWALVRSIDTQITWMEQLIKLLGGQTPSLPEPNTPMSPILQ